MIAPDADTEFVHEGLGTFAVHSWHADLEARLEKVFTADLAQVHLGINGRIGRETGLPFWRR
jgi:hypothetical protein